MKKYAWMTAALLMLAGSTQAAGMLELRGGVGLNAANPEDFEDRANAVSGESLDADNFDNFNADIFWDIPMFPIGVGLRQEWIQGDQSSGGSDWDVDATNTSLLVDWRIINTGIYLGPIVGIGIPSGDINFHSNSESVKNHVKSQDPSYSAGAEVGVKLGRFLVGAEAGYLSLKLEETQSQNGGVNAKVDLSCFYGNVMVGISLF